MLVQATSAGFQILSNKGGCNATAEKSWGCRTSTKELGQSIGSYAYFVSSNPATWVSPGVTISGYTVDVSYSNGDAYITASLSTKQLLQLVPGAILQINFLRDRQVSLLMPI